MLGHACGKRENPVLGDVVVDPNQNVLPTESWYFRRGRCVPASMPFVAWSRSCVGLWPGVALVWSVFSHGLSSLREPAGNPERSPPSELLRVLGLESQVVPPRPSTAPPLSPTTHRAGPCLRAAHGLFRVSRRTKGVPKASFELRAKGNDGAVEEARIFSIEVWHGLVARLTRDTRASGNIDTKDGKMTDPFHLQRFVEAQKRFYPSVLAELRAGVKRSHWMWFMFPQAGLGYSPTAQRYAIKSLPEAKAYYLQGVHRPRPQVSAQERSANIWLARRYQILLIDDPIRCR